MTSRVLGLAMSMLALAAASLAGCEEDSERDCSADGCPQPGAVCPTEAPAEGSPCKFVAEPSGDVAPCPYTLDGGKLVAECVCTAPSAGGSCSRSWSYNGGCPAQPPSGGSPCSVVGRRCEYPAASVTALCGCTVTDGTCVNDWRLYEPCQSDASDASTCNAPTLPTAACSACGHTSCLTEYEVCGSDPSCNAFIQCATTGNCADQACIDACAQSNPPGPAWSFVGACEAAKCAAECQAG